MTLDKQGELQQLAEELQAERPGPYEARYVRDAMPTICCHFGVISLGAKGVEVCRTWIEAEARFLAAVSPDVVLDLLHDNQRMRELLKQSVDIIYSVGPHDLGTEIEAFLDPTTDNASSVT